MEVSCDRTGSSSDGPDEHITQTVPTSEMNTSQNMRKYCLVLGERGIQVLDIVTAASSSAPVAALTPAPAAVPSADASKSPRNPPGRQQQPAPVGMEDAGLPPPVLAESADGGEDGSPSPVVQNDTDMKFQPLVKMEEGETECILPEVGTVPAPEECFERDPLELTSSEVKCKEENVPQSTPPPPDVAGSTETHSRNSREQQVVPAVMAGAVLPSPLLVESADSGEGIRTSSVIDDHDDVMFQPTVKVELESEGEAEVILPEEVGTVSAPEECPESDSLEWTSSETECEEEDVIEVECGEEDVTETPVLESPLFEDFKGFTATDLNKTLEAVRSKVQLLYRCIAAKPQASRNAASPSQEQPKRCHPVGSHREDDLAENSAGDATGSYCDECYCEWAGGCPLHGPMEVVPDTKVPSDTGDPERCVKTLPECLKAGRSRIQVADTGRLNGVLAKKDVPARQRFGPYEGVITSDGSQERTIGYSWQIKRFYDVHHYVSAADASRSNWLRLVNCARTEEEQNLIAFQYKYRIYYRTCKPIAKGSELLVYFGDDYIRDLNASVQPCPEPEKTPPREQVPTVDPSTSSSGEETADLKRDRLDRLVKKRQQHISENVRHKCSPTANKGATVHQYKCKWCPFSTDKPGRFGRHRKTHTEKRPHRCDVCGEKFIKLHGLTRHHRLHTDERQHKCDVCGKAFLQLGAMMHHRRVHTAGEKRYKCDVCVKAFTTMSTLKTHRRTHTGEKVRQCEQCGVSFSVISNYTRHMRNHSDIKAHRCKVCAARFVHRTGLTEHMRTHTGQRPHACSFCPARFANQSARNRHVVFIHTHDYRHRCDRCGKGFVVPSLLQTHMAKCVAGN